MNTFKQRLIKELHLVEEMMFCFTSHTKVHELILYRDALEELIYSK